MRSKQKIKYLSSLILVLLVCSVFVQISFAAGTSYIPLSPLPGLTSGSVVDTTTSKGFEEYIKQLYIWGVALTSGLAVLVIMWGGVGYVTSAGGGGVEEAKGRISAAITGLLLALGSYIILQTINRDLLNVKFDLATLNIQISSAGNTPSTYVNTSGNASGVTRWGFADAGTMEGQTIDARFTYYSSTERINDTNTMAGRNAVGGQLVVGGESPDIVGSAASNYYPPGTIISMNKGGQNYYYVVDDNNIGASNNNLNNNHTFDIYTNQTVPELGKVPNGTVTIEYVPDTRLTNNEVNSLHDITNVQSKVGR